MTGQLGRGKTGVARLALTTGAPVVPVGLIGTFDLLPKNRPIPGFAGRKSITITIGEPIDIEALPAGTTLETVDVEHLRGITNRIMHAIAKLIGQSYEHDKPSTSQGL